MVAQVEHTEATMGGTFASALSDPARQGEGDAEARLQNIVWSLRHLKGRVQRLPQGSWLSLDLRFGLGLGAHQNGPGFPQNNGPSKCAGLSTARSLGEFLMRGFRRDKQR
jgi:hypothetical protein